MNFSKSFLDDLRARVSLSDLVGEKISWDLKKTKSNQGDFWAPCPFHEEKTASFHVDSNKGFYYCFGCQAKGDCFTFLKDYDRLSFLESVTYLASRVGVALPVIGPQAKKNDQEEANLLKIHQEASGFFEAQLRTSNGIACRQYLKDREITEKAIEHFNIGFASHSRNGLYEYLREKRFNQSSIINSGLCMLSEKGSEPFDRFRNRVMFPIKDLRGKIIAFGGRSLDATTPAKYLNSPETPLFSKGKVIYNYSNAKAVIRPKTPLLLVEGYMDVITLFQAGFPNTVAPLGTAITKSQLDLMWRLHSEPIVLFDGDKAGRKATSKLLELALPSLEPEKSLRFGRLPNDQDPDDFFKSEGKEALLNLVKKARPAIQVLWTDLTDSLVFDSPERKAALDINLKKSIGKIKNSTLRRHFSDEINEIRKEFFADLNLYKQNKSSANFKNFKSLKRAVIENPLNETKNSFLGSQPSNLNVELRLKEGIIIIGCLNHPIIAHAIENDLSRLHFSFNDMKRIRDAILAELPVEEGFASKAFKEKVNARLKFNAIEKLEKIPQLKIHPHLTPKASPMSAREAIQEAMNHHKSLINFQLEIKAAENEFFDASNENVTNRIDMANKTLQRAIKGKKPQILSDDKLTRASSKRLNVMVKDKIWLKKK